MKNLRQLLALVIALVIVTVYSTFAGGNSIAIVSGVDKVTNVTLPAPWSTTVSAGTFKATVNGTQTSLYCIDLSHFLATGQNYVDVEQTDSVMTYILNNYFPFKTGYAGQLSPDANEATAVQLALWHFSDGLNINNVTGTTAAIKTRALDIVTAANLNARSYGLSTFAINLPIQSFATGTPINFTVQAFNVVGIAMPNVVITLSTTGGTLSTTSCTTGVTGVSSTVTLTPTSSMQNATITATGVVVIPSGTKYFHQADPNGKQKLILATPVTASRTISKAITWFEDIQLSVTKTADKERVHHGDIINYTLVCKNNGQSRAENVKVSEQLVSELHYVSSTPAGFNHEDGEWIVGTLNGGESKSLTIKCEVRLEHDTPTLLDFSEANDFNLFVIDTLICPSSDTEGKVAVGKYADLRNYSVGDKLAPNSGKNLVVGGHLTFITGRVYNGKATYGNYITSTTMFTADDGIEKDSSINFNQAKLHLEDLSNQLSALSSTDTTSFEWNHLTFEGHSNSRNIFKVDGSKFTQANNVTINCPAGSTAIININGDNVEMHGGFEVLGTEKEKVILNFYNAKNIKISNIDVRATVLAPKVRLNFPAGLVTGQVIVKSFFGSGQVNLSKFNGTIVADTAIANFATVCEANHHDMPGSFFSAPSSVITPSSSVTGIETGKSDLPKEFKLEQNYPNPFNPSTVISFALPKNEVVNLTVYNVTGQVVASLINSELQAGNHSVSFNAQNLPTGIYIYRISSPSFNSVKKMILMK